MKDCIKEKTVLTGLSGGVDSTATTLILRENGYNVLGCYLDMHENGQKGLPKGLEEFSKKMNIEMIYSNVHSEFKTHVISGFCNSYCLGETPNPCIICNPTVKFKSLLELSEVYGIQLLSTGHYAKVVYDKDLDTWFVEMADNMKKDQSYMLYRLPQNILKRLILPLGKVKDKEEAREIVRQNNLENAEAKDSQEICFIPSHQSYGDYIKNFMEGQSIEKGNENRHNIQGRHILTLSPGRFVDREGKTLGQHKGLINYTLGQRKGLGIALGKPIFVTKLNPGDNTVVLGDQEDLFSNEVVSRDHVFPLSRGADFPEGYEGLEVMAKIRYAAPPMKAVIKSLPNGRIKTTFEQPQRAATPGQSIVFYLGKRVIGGGIIDHL